jgi:hypothetical protein
LCAEVPILATGREKPGKSLVIDFESPYFVGNLLMQFVFRPLMMQITTKTGRLTFDGKRRKFQATIKGKFKDTLKMIECVTGAGV